MSDGGSSGHLSGASGEGDEQLGRCPQWELVITTSESCQGNFRVIEETYVSQLIYAKQV